MDALAVLHIWTRLDAEKGQVPPFILRSGTFLLASKKSPLPSAWWPTFASAEDPKRGAISLLLLPFSSLLLINRRGYPPPGMGLEAAYN